MSAMSSQLKDLVTDFMDNNGAILEKPKFRTIKVGISEDRIDFLRQLVDLLINSRWLNTETKLYIQDRFITKEGVYDELRHRGNTVNPNTIRSNIHNDIKKVTSAFGERFLIETIEYSNSDITSYKQILADIRVKKSNSKLLDTLGIALPKGDSTTSISNEEFEDFKTIIQPYTRNQMKFISENISASAVGYARYILCSTLLTDTDKQRKDILLELLSGDENNA